MFIGYFSRCTSLSIFYNYFPLMHAKGKSKFIHVNVAGKPMVSWAN